MIPQQQLDLADHTWITYLANHAINIEDSGMLASDIELESLEELEFYQWLEEYKHAD